MTYLWWKPLRPVVLSAWWSWWQTCSLTSASPQKGNETQSCLSGKYSIVPDVWSMLYKMLERAAQWTQVKDGLNLLMLVGNWAHEIFAYNAFNVKSNNQLCHLIYPVIQCSVYFLLILSVLKIYCSALYCTCSVTLSHYLHIQMVICGPVSSVVSSVTLEAWYFIPLYIC